MASASCTIVIVVHTAMIIAMGMGLNVCSIQSSHFLEYIIGDHIMSDHSIGSTNIHSLEAIPLRASLYLT